MRDGQEGRWCSGDLLCLGAVTLKCCMSEDIQVAQLAALKEGSKEAKVSGPASIWTSWSASPCALITSHPLTGPLVTYKSTFTIVNSSELA